MVKKVVVEIAQCLFWRLNLDQAKSFFNCVSRLSIAPGFFFLFFFFLSVFHMKKWQKKNLCYELWLDQL